VLILMERGVGIQHGGELRREETKRVKHYVKVLGKKKK